MKHVLQSLITLLAFLSIYHSAEASTGIKLFAKAEAQNEAKVYLDDSIVVSVYAYATLPFGDVEVSDKLPRVSGCRVRRIGSARRLTQNITRVDGKPYYTILCAQYVVAGLKKGTTTFPKVDLNVVLLEEDATSQDRSRSFFDFFDDIFRQPSYKQIKKTTQTTQLKLEVTTAPQKTFDQLKREGKTII